jgi:tRNA 2-thiocytidine biosynthesis protein TtcA
MQSEKLSKFDKRLIEKVRHTINRTIEEQNLICEGDHVLVGVSGGKDSLILLETLATRRRYVKEKYFITAVHVKVKNISYKIDKTWLSNFCKKLNVDFIYREIEYEQDEKHKSPCYFCSWSRRNEFFTLSKELGCNKIATGHHLDDAIEFITFFYNNINPTEFVSKRIPLIK